MLKVLYLMILASLARSQQNDPAAEQMFKYKNNTMSKRGILTTCAGAPVDYNEAMYTLNTNLISNEHFVDILAHAVTERIPERVLHAPGTGAFGYFKTTHDISHICKAKLFSKVGKKTPVAVRFSLTGPRNGIKDTTRETSRGFVAKFYTEEGNLDLPGLNTPCFTFKDPMLFPHLIHVMKPNPATNLQDSNMLWDFILLNPESMHQTLYILSDYGYPKSYRHMPSYCIHTYEVYNAKGESSFVRFYFIPDAGIKNLNSTEVQEINAGYPNYYTRDLYNAIANGENPSWELKIQVLKVGKYEDYDIFDVTNTMPYDKFPLITVGKLVLNRNPLNHFAEMEQLATCPGNLVPGILGGPDKMFEARRLAYRLAQTHRLGSNFKNIPVNCPIHGQPLTYIRDGVPPLNGNGKNAPNYFPNSFGGPEPCVEQNKPSLIKINEKPANNYKQASDFYSKGLNSVEKTSLVGNIVKSLCECENSIRVRAVKLFKIINSELANRVSKGLATKCT